MANQLARPGARQPIGARGESTVPGDEQGREAQLPGKEFCGGGGGAPDHRVRQGKGCCGKCSAEASASRRDAESGRSSLRSR